MSLINDALRQTQQAQPPAATPAPGPALSPVSLRAERENKFLLPALIAAAVLTAGILLWAGSGGNELEVRAKSNVSTTNPAPAADATAPAPVTAPAAPAMSSPPAATTEGATSPAPSTDVVKPQASAYKLQAIFVKKNSIAAVINGKTVSVGDHVGEARVTALDRESATLVTETGQTRHLDLPY
jgi:hypothetical protein